MRAIAAALVVLAGALAFSAGLLTVALYDCFAQNKSGPGVFGVAAGTALAVIGLAVLALSLGDRRP